MNYCIGIDSGGTHYRMRALSPDGALLGEMEGQVASHYRFRREESARRIRENLTALLDSFGGKPEEKDGRIHAYGHETMGEPVAQI